MPAQYDFYPNPPSEKKKPRLHARVITTGTVGTDEIARQIHSRCTVTTADVKAVLSALADVAVDRFKRGERIHIEGFGYFQITLSCPPVRTDKEIRAESIKFDSVAFRPEQCLKDSLKNMEFKRVPDKHHSKSRTEDEVLSRLAHYFKTHSSISRRGFEALMGYTKTTANRRLRDLIEKKILRKAGLYQFPVYEPGEEFREG